MCTSENQTQRKILLFIQLKIRLQKTILNINLVTVTKAGKGKQNSRKRATFT